MFDKNRFWTNVGIGLGFNIVALNISVIYLNHYDISRFTIPHWLSIVGLWLTGIGIVGNDRLVKWEKSLKSIYSNHLLQIVGSFVKTILFGAVYGVLFQFLLFPLFQSIIKIPHLAPNFLMAFFTSWVGSFFALGLLFLGTIFTFPILIILIYLLLIISGGIYKLLKMISSESTFERLLIFLGLILGTFGLIFNL
jgi:hypothetical protein